MQCYITHYLLQSIVKHVLLSTHCQSKHWPAVYFVSIHSTLNRTKSSGPMRCLVCTDIAIFTFVWLMVDCDEWWIWAFQNESRIRMSLKSVGFRICAKLLKYDNIQVWIQTLSHPYNEAWFVPFTKNIFVECRWWNALNTLIIPHLFLYIMSFGLHQFPLAFITVCILLYIYTMGHKKGANLFLSVTL